MVGKNINIFIVEDDFSLEVKSGQQYLDSEYVWIYCLCEQ